MRAIVPGNEDDTVIGQIVGYGHRLFRVAGVIANNHPDRLAEDATRSVDVVHRHFGAAHILLAEPGILPGHWTSRRDQDIGSSRRRTESRDRDTGEENCRSEDHHFALSPMSTGLAALSERDIDGGL